MFETLPMSGIEPRISGVESDRSANCATATAHWSVTFMIAYNEPRKGCLKTPLKGADLEQGHWTLLRP